MKKFKILGGGALTAASFIYFSTRKPLIFAESKHQVLYNNNRKKIIKDTAIDCNSSRYALEKRNLNPLWIPFRLVHLGVIFMPAFVSFPFWFVENKLFPHRQSLWWVRMVRNLLEYAGPMYIKLGQWISVKTDTLPKEICNVFSELQSNVSAHSFSYSKKAIQEAMKCSIDEIKGLKEIPIGVGSVAQVYRGRYQGMDIAIKVLHPNVKENLIQDLYIFNLFGLVLHHLPFARLQDLGISQEINTFSNMILAQTDLLNEGENLMRFGDNFKDYPFITLPEYLPHLSSEKVLVETFQKGLPLRYVIENGPTVYDKEIAEKGLQAMAKMVLQDNFVHADLHSGNVLVRFLKEQERNLLDFGKTQYNLDLDLLDQLQSCKTPLQVQSCLEGASLNGRKLNLVILDVGLTNTLQSHNIETVRDCFRTGLEYDGESLARLFIQRSKFPERVQDQPGLIRKLVNMMNSISNNDRGEVLLSRLFALDVVRNLTSLFRTHRITLDGDFSGVFIAGLISEGIGRTLNADLDVLPVLSDYLCD